MANKVQGINTKGSPFYITEKDLYTRVAIFSSHTTEKHPLIPILAKYGRDSVYIINTDPNSPLYLDKESCKNLFINKLDFTHVDFYTTEDVLEKARDEKEFAKIIASNSLARGFKKSIMLINLVGAKASHFEIVSEIFWREIANNERNIILQAKPLFIISGLIEYLHEKNVNLSNMFSTMSSQTRALGIPFVFIESSDGVYVGENNSNISFVLSNIGHKIHASDLNISPVH